ncbi:MAG: gamma-glutamyltransferase [Rhodospirillales bacterium]|nr:MAG: gamma-glutamyltransferase [Rhodospirillales bacterium]
MLAGGLVACGHPATAQAAAAVLAEGGNAFDAALAAMCAATVAEPMLASLGGGGFLLARPSTGRHQGQSLAYDFFVQTPLHRRDDGAEDFFPIDADFGPATQQFHIGIGAIATPGAVRGLFEIHRDLGFMPLRQVLEPAVTLARDGVRIDSMQAYVFGVLRAMLDSRESIRVRFTRPEQPGTPLAEGDVLRLPELADTLEVLAIEGDDLFYRGEIARTIAEECRTGGGHLSREDFEAYRVERRRPLGIDFCNHQLFLNPPPSAGGILIAFALELLRDGGFGEWGFGTAAMLDRLARVLTLTQRARVESRLHELDAESVSATLLDPALLSLYRREVAGQPSTARGTTHISVVDRDGNAAGLSLSNGEGSGYVVPQTGIILNNMLGEEDINPHGLRRWPENARMSSMMAPTLVLGRDGSILALGSGGSNRLRSAILQVLLNLLVFRMAPEQAVASPRLHVESDRVSIEPGFADAAVAALARSMPKAEIDRWSAPNLFFGGVHVACRDAAGRLTGAGDARRGGAAVRA